MLCDFQIAGNSLYENDLLRMKASLLLKCGERNEARAIYEHILLAREFTWAKVGLAKILLQDGEHLLACQMFQEVIAENPLYLDAYDQLAAAHKCLGQSEQACGVLERAAKLSPNSVLRQKGLGEVSLRLGDVTMAEKAFRKCITVGEHSINRTSDPYFGLARVCGLKQSPQEAMQILATVQKKFSGGSSQLRARITEGLIYLDNGDAHRARAIGQELEAMLAAASAADLPEPNTCMDIATLLFEVGGKEPAVKLLYYTIQNNDNVKAISDEVQKVFDYVGMPDEGAAMIAAARKEVTEIMNQGVLLWKTDRLEEAVEWMRAERKKLPGNLRVLLNTAQILISHVQKRGYDPSLAIEAAEVLAQVSKVAPGLPRHVELHEQLATLGADTGAGLGRRAVPNPTGD